MSEIETDLRARIQKSPLSLYAISRRSGVDLSYLSRFVHERQSLGKLSIDRVCDALGLKVELTEK